MNRWIDQYVRNAAERERVRAAEALAARFAERAGAHDRDGSFPFDNMSDLFEAGYLRLTVPKRYGGDEISLYELVLLQERLAYGDGATALAVGWHLGQTLHFRECRKWPEPLFAELCRDIVRDGAMINTFASEPASGSPSRGGKPETEAVRTDGGWLISGRKTFSTLSPILDRFVVTAFVPEEGAVGEFLVRKGEGVTVEETWNTLGMRATGSHDVVLDRAFVSSDARLEQAKVDDGGGWLLHIPACYMGIAIAARDFALDFARTYKPNSVAAPIGELPTVQQSIGLMETELRTARSLLYATADRWDREREGRAALKPDLGLTKYVVTNGAIKIVDLAMRIVGGASLSKRLPLERYARDVRAGLYNPPMDNNVLTLLAKAALGETGQG
ncbi:acyl-CoA dehydrogenase family protein [Paenibacillus sp.]|uniref:acyl-CoA dehydrogenase family protein n=1 Tax=Paenibacillus sp. TaxID=58172 RepID=UPI002810A76E|nr:acyl-CoA dehydrogenase family protein [Paenibacillus sp.]